MQTAPKAPKRKAQVEKKINNENRPENTVEAGPKPKRMREGQMDNSLSETPDISLKRRVDGNQTVTRVEALPIQFGSSEHQIVPVSNSDDGMFISAQGNRVSFEGMRGQMASGGITNSLISDQVSIQRKRLTLDLKRGKLVGSKEGYKSTEGPRNLLSSESAPNTSAQTTLKKETLCEKRDL